MEKPLNVINQMQVEGLFTKYAIGGGIAALFYIEPFATFDLDIFVILPETPRALISLSPLYDWLAQRGYETEKEQVIIEGIPVQFIPVYNDLVKDAVQNAVEKAYGNTKTFVLRQEYLVAIMLQTLRPKDRDRLIKFLDGSELSSVKLAPILMKHNLKAAYDNFKRRYYDK